MVLYQIQQFMTKKKLKPDKIQEAILEKFSTQRELADTLGIDEGNLSNKIKRGSNKFIKQLESIGVVIGKNITKDSATSYITGGDVNQSGKEVSYLLRKIIELEEANIKLKEELGKYSST